MHPQKRRTMDGKGYRVVLFPSLIRPGETLKRGFEIGSTPHGSDVDPATQPWGLQEEEGMGCIPYLGSK